MTIITHPIVEKKLKENKPLVEGQLNGQEELVPSAPPNGDVEAMRGSLLVTVSRGRGGGQHHHSGTSQHRLVNLQRARRVNSLVTLVVLLMAVFVFAIGLLGATYLYREFNNYKMRHFRGWCSVPFNSQQLIGSEFAVDNDDQRSQPDWLQSMTYNLDKSKEYGNSDAYKSYNQFFDEEFDIDIEYEEYERIEVPDFVRGRRGRFIHDFSMNKTGIIDLNAGRCFILPLNRTTVLPPASLYDLITKMKSGYYQVQTEIVRESYQVVFPMIQDIKEVGLYIGRECANYPSYHLEKVYKPVFKRHVEKRQRTVFAEFAGNKISEIDIINLHAAPGRKLN